VRVKKKKGRAAHPPAIFLFSQVCAPPVAQQRSFLFRLACVRLEGEQGSARAPSLRAADALSRA